MSSDRPYVRFAADGAILLDVLPPVNNQLDHEPSVLNPHSSNFVAAEEAHFSELPYLKGIETYSEAQNQQAVTVHKK